MRLVIGFVFAAALAVTPAAAFEGCGGYAKVVASTAAPATPVQTAEVPSTTQTK